MLKLDTSAMEDLAAVSGEGEEGLVSVEATVDTAERGALKPTLIPRH